MSNSTITFHKIVAPPPEVLSQIIEVQVEALHHDPFRHCLVGGDWSILPALERALVGAVHVAGEIWVAQDGDEIVAFAGWFGPGRELLDGSPEQEAAGWNDFAELMPTELRDFWYNDFTPSFDGFVEETLGAGMKKKSWDLALLATRPDYQRRGIGRRLVEVKEKQLAQDGEILVCLESATEKNTRLYESWGWQVQGHRTFSSPYGWYDTWVMTKSLNSCSFPPAE
ncbi:acyl-CoA N-acyltransferase [Cristinia sonorae]|uniref:Acyl-CoA N-acyltransferase n=1 Tax=Cristinia sonorae TaxID=1940300 RepID=A0A8K0UHV5_9AGAR|nr:acyl-CoA N-acyltransferase [Cristinia sonorae]